MATPECATCANDDCGGNDTGVPCEKFKTKAGMSYDYTDKEKKELEESKKLSDDTHEAQVERFHQRFLTEEGMRQTAYRMMDAYSYEMNTYEYAAWSEVHQALCKLAGYYEDQGATIWKH